MNLTLMPKIQVIGQLTRLFLSNVHIQLNLRKKRLNLSKMSLHYMKLLP